MTIEDSLILLNNSKQAIKTAIETKGVTVGNAPLADYAGKIGEIATGLELPNLGASFAGGYYMGILYLSDGIFANIMSPLSSGQNNSRAYRTVNGSQGATNRIDPRPNMTALSLAQNQAAQYCTGLSIGGKSDWLLPSFHQLLQACNVCFSNNWVSSSAWHLGTGYWFWSSTEQSTDFAYALRSMADTGTFVPEVDHLAKTSNRAARAFRLEPLLLY